MQEHQQPTAHLMIGFIGSGKTTFSRKLERDMGVVRFTKDEWTVKIFGDDFTKGNLQNDTFQVYDGKMTKLATEIGLRFLKTGTSVIIDDSFWYRKQRDEMRQTLQDIGAIPIFHYLDTPVDVMRDRTVQRSKNLSVDSFYITEQEFNEYLKLFEPPTDDEDFTVIRYSAESIL